MRLTIVFVSCAALLGCVSAPTEAPKLTEGQNERVRYVDIYKVGETPGQPYSEIGAIDAAACSDGKVIEILKRKTVALGGTAVIAFSCKSASVKDCPSGRTCTGTAVRWN